MNRTIIITLLLILLTLSTSCAVVEVIPELLVYPLTKLDKPCPGSTNRWEGTAGSPCPSLAPIDSRPDVPSVAPNCKPNLFPAVTYAGYCASCHDSGKAPDFALSVIAARATYGELSYLIASGKESMGMPAFGARLTPCDLDSVAEYIKSRKSGVEVRR